MIYLPASYDEHEWQRVNRLLLSDPILYTWLHWQIKYTNELLWGRPKVRQEKTFVFDTSQIYWRMRFGIDDRPQYTPFVVPPV